MGNRLSGLLRTLLVVCLCAPLAGAKKQPQDNSHAYRSGTTEWGVLNALGRQALLERQLRQSVRPLGAAPPTAAMADVGDIAVLNDDGTLMTQPNVFDLQNKSVRFTPAGGGYRVAAGTDPVDTAAASAGTPLTLDDDDTREVRIGFSFPFFGRSYDSVFVNSDGNLTFTAGDVAISERDLARFLTGVPRIAPFFNDLNPADGGQVTYSAEAGRFVVTWTGVPECCAPPRQPISTFQVRLFPDGRIEFAYGAVNAQSAVVGISPGRFTDTPRVVDLSAADGNETILLPVAEVFAIESELSETAITKKFYETHEDAYDFLVIWTNSDAGLPPGVFAYERNISNNITGIGVSRFNFSSDFGSAGRFTSLLLLADLTRYPSDPKQIIAGLGENNTLSVMGQEGGHRWLAYFRYPDGTNPRSVVLLGRDNAHWSFFFNSEASVMEGNEIRDNGDGSFTTTDTVKRYNAIDQYAMGLRAPEEIPPTFVVTNTDLSNPGRSPRTGLTFRGTRLDVTADKLVEANGRRLPTSAVAPKDSSFAFILVGGRTTPATPEQIQQLDTIRQAWAQFWGEATGGRGRANTRLVRALSLVGLPAATVPPTQVSVRLRAAGTSDAARTFTLATSASSVASVPASLTIPAGAREAEFRVTPGTGGVARISATAAGYETAEGAVSVGNAATLQLTAISGSGQVATPAAQLPQPLVAELRDSNTLPVPGATLSFSGPSGTTFSPTSPVTDANGRAQTTVTLGSTPGVITLAASVAGFAAVRATFSVTALGPAVVPPGSAVNGASFAPAPAPVSPGSIISIFGTNLAADTRQAASLPLSTILGNVTVRINGIPSPLFLVSPGQLNVQVPFEISGTTASLVVNNGTSPSSPINISVGPGAPGIFTTLQNGTGPGAVTHGDGSLVSAGAPARSGEVVAIFCTGLGAVTPAVESGRASPTNPPATTTAAPRVTIGGQAAEVVFSGLAPGFVGLYQVNVRIPSGLPAGTQPLVINSTLNSNTAMLAVQ